MTMKNKSEHKGKKKDNLGWEIIKLQAQIGETSSRKAKKAVEAAEKKKEGTTPTSTSTDLEVLEEASKKALSEAAEKLLKLKEQKISQKIYQAKKEIKKAFVKAKGQETQRLVKRLKEARKSIESKNEEAGNAENATEETKPKKKQEFTAEDVTKFENELELVKKMDMDTLSAHAFNTKLAKHPILGSHQLMEPYVKVASKKNGETTEKDNVIQAIESRLTNTKAVKEQMTKLCDEMEHIVTGKKVDHNELKKKRKSGDDQDEPESKKTKTNQDTKKAQKSDSTSGSDEEGGEEDEDVNMSDISGDEGYDDGYDSDGLPLPMNGKGKATTASSMFIGSLNEGDSKRDKKNKDKKGKKDKNDWVDDKFDEIYGKIKKNRPGQRARRMKAELKYGKEANHVKKAEEEARIREEKKAARKAKMEKLNASSANSQRVPNRRTIGAGDGSAAVHHQPVQSKAKTPSGPDPNDPTLHPSWLAKQTEKAAMAAALSGAKSNKIVFDDSD
ncbi:hypothetical protein BGZ49_008179 [Haplosporangium sp. Z 27]|nr:hypothetical protein BGZ49_008179 [Haplosporangium sp. Z 27]